MTQNQITNKWNNNDNGDVYLDFDYKITLIEKLIDLFLFIAIIPTKLNF